VEEVSEGTYKNQGEYLSWWAIREIFSKKIHSCGVEAKHQQTGNPHISPAVNSIDKLKSDQENTMWSNPRKFSKDTIFQRNLHIPIPNKQFFTLQSASSKAKEFKQGEMSAKSKRFFRVVLTHNLDSGTLELPRDFMEEQGEKLSKNVSLIVPNGAESKMELKRSEDKGFLHKGWLEFAEKYSIESRSILVFKYEGGSRFSVNIFDLSSVEIIYPVISPNTRHKNAVSKEDSDDISDEQGMNYTSQSRKLETGQGNLKAREKRVLERAMAFESPNPHFIVTMKKTYASGYYYLYIKGHLAKSLIFEKRKDRMCLKLKGADEKTWPMEYIMTKSGVKVHLGWNVFALDNDLQIGDICAFELVNKKVMVFNVTIFRLTVDKEEVGPLVRTDFSPTPRKGKSGADSNANANAMKRVMKRAESFKSENPHFRICITSANIGSARVEIPRAHSRRYLKEDENGEKYIVLHGSSGRTWPVDYYHSLSNQSSTSKEVFLTHGWIEFVEDNHLQEGDYCIFEMLMSKSKAYKITTYRVDDHP
ncbi:hypothetical protein V2J09_020316, partial [Rumex salicifolius]